MIKEKNLKEENSLNEENCLKGENCLNEENCPKDESCLNEENCLKEENSLNEENCPKDENNLNGENRFKQENHLKEEKNSKEKVTEKEAKLPREKRYGLLAAGAILLIAGILFSLYAYNTTYQESLAVGAELSDAKAAAAAIKDGSAQGDPKAADALVSALSGKKLNLERPYSYGLVAVFFAVLLTVKGLYNAIIGVQKSNKADIKRLSQAGLLAALCYIGFAFFKIDIPAGTEKASFHFGNVFCVLAALLLGGYWGGLAGAAGMTIGDLTTTYVTSAPKTFMLKLCIGLIVGLVAHKIFRLSKNHSAKYVTGVTVLACVCGMGFNVVADPVVGYFYKTYLFGVPQDITKVLVKISALTTSVNAVVAVFAASVIYLALRPALRKAGLFTEL